MNLTTNKEYKKMRSKITILVAVLSVLAFLSTDAASAHSRRRAKRPVAQVVPAATTTVVQETPLLDPSNFKGEGAGMYVDASTAMQLSTFTINKRMVSCGVGTLAARDIGTTGPFGMMMYSTKIDSYNVDESTGTIRVEGTMRSITRAGNVVSLPINPGSEDVLHPFVAIATDRSGPSAPMSNDSFNVHFKTPLWNTSFPPCTPSTVVSGGCRFGSGSGISMGDVVAR